MNLKRYSSIVILFVALIFLGTMISCKSDNLENLVEDTPVGGVDNEPDNNTPDPDNNPDFETAGTIELFNEALMDDNYILVNDASNNRAYIMDKKAQILHEWPLTNGLGNDAFLLPNGQLLASLDADVQHIELGGQAGKIQLIDADGTVKWNFDHSSENYITHHDVEMLPNGNIITMVWEKIPAEEATMAGFNLNIDIFPEAIIEINPGSDQIVWEWHATDHLIQDFDDTKENYGVVADRPELININYVPNVKGDVMHANGISYDKTNDLIYMSVNFFHEVWVIDHSTTTQEAASHAGGNFNKGGDLIYRFGNPSAYNNDVGERLFHNNHFPNLLDGADQGKILIFTNGGSMEQSTVLELQIPNDYGLQKNTDNEPNVTWSFTDPDLYSPKVSGAVRLPNGNRLITEGDFGIWEVTESGEVVWKFMGDGFFWRSYHYAKDAPEIKIIGL